MWTPATSTGSVTLPEFLHSMIYGINVYNISALWTESFPNSSSDEIGTLPSSACLSDIWPLGWKGGYANFFRP